MTKTKKLETFDRDLEKQVYIIAIDFDGTICKGGYPDVTKGKLISSTVLKMKNQLEEKPNTEFILWTCRTGQHLEDAKGFCKKHDLPIHYFNEPHPSVFEWFDDVESRKIFAHEYWDDRAVRIE